VLIEGGSSGGGGSGGGYMPPEEEPEPVEPETYEETMGDISTGTFTFRTKAIKLEEPERMITINNDIPELPVEQEDYKNEIFTFIVALVSGVVLIAFTVYKNKKRKSNEN